MKKNGIIILIAVVIVLFIGVLVYVNQNKLTNQSVNEEIIPENIEVPVESNGLNVEVPVSTSTSGETNKKIADCDKVAGDPVCGVDGYSYANSCIAEVNNIKVKHAGQCLESETKKP